MPLTDKEMRLIIREFQVSLHPAYAQIVEKLRMEIKSLQAKRRAIRQNRAKVLP